MSKRVMKKVASIVGAIFSGYGPVKIIIFFIIKQITRSTLTKEKYLQKQEKNGYKGRKIKWEKIVVVFVSYAVAVFIIQVSRNVR